jgi:proline iminopeptidase
MSVAMNNRYLEIVKISILIILLSALSAINLAGNEIYSKSFGNPDNPAIIFLHGGPGFNCANFEATTAKPLADEGFFVIVYDRRGEGRSVDSSANFTFAESNRDLLSLFEKYNIEKASLIAHSYGGQIAGAFTREYTDKVNAIFLVGAPLSMQDTFDSIIENVRAKMTERDLEKNIYLLDTLKALDRSTIEFSSRCFMFAMSYNLYSPTNSTEKAQELYRMYFSDSLMMNYARNMTMEAPLGFHKNEQYTTIDMAPDYRKFVSEYEIPVIGIYGNEDGLFTPGQLKKYTGITGKENMFILENCSHNVFMDRQDEFLRILKETISK